jgi:hypothetical protein
MKRFVIPALLSTLLLAASAQAHQIWLQQDAKSASLYFGEFGENLREASPGLLDRFGQPSAILLGGGEEKPLTLTKGKDAFALPERAGKNQSIIAQDAHYPVFEHKTGEVVTRTAWTPAARLITSDAEQAPRLTLDIVPTGKHGEFKLFYKGQPLPKTKVGVITASGWGKEAYSSEQGLVTFDLPWQGTYVVEAHYTDKTAGERDGKAYDVASFVTTLSLIEHKGLPSLPAPPAMKPNK